MKAKRIIALFVIFSLMMLILSCETLGSVIPAGSTIAKGLELASTLVKAFEEITPEQEYYIGRAVGANILSAYKLQTNKPVLTSYLNKICGALIINSPRPEIFNGYHVSMLDSNEINAFATPGGHIFVTRGLVNCAASEDALASVIAHEIAHIQLQHGLKAIKSSRKAAAFSSSLSLASEITAKDSRFSELVGSFSDGVNEIVTNMMTKGYSRTQEFEADSTALQLLSMAGYKPSSLLDILQILAQKQSSQPGGFNSTHPTPAQRIENLQKKVGSYYVPDTSSFRNARFKASTI